MLTVVLYPLAGVKGKAGVVLTPIPVMRRSVSALSVWLRSYSHDCVCLKVDNGLNDKDTLNSNSMQRYEVYF